MRLFHGSTLRIPHPKISFSKRFLDFGPGFYLTNISEQAEKWAKRKALRIKSNAIINIYELEDDLSQYKILRFEEENEQWLDFICACRKGSNDHQNYDIIMGSVANDDVFQTVDLYFNGIWDKGKALQEIRYYELSNQVCILNQSIIEKKTRFIDSYEVEYAGKA